MSDSLFRFSPISVLTVITVTTVISVTHIIGTIYRTRFGLFDSTVQKLIHTLGRRYDII